MSHFKPEEFRCPCCGLAHVEKALLDKLEVAREIYGRPMVIASGVRCKKHNEEVGGVPESAHVKGEAADVACSFGTNRYDMLMAFFAAGFQRIGVSSTFIHVDVSETLPQKVCWTY